MKKLLIASTALILSASVASAQGVNVSGDARMGLVYDGNDVKMTSRARVTFTMTGEADTGMTFGASFRADQAGVANGDTMMTGGSVFISGDFGKLSMGDVPGAARAAVGDLYGVGLTGLGDMHNMTYLDRRPNLLGNPLYGLDRRTSALYEYSIDGLTVFAGLGQNNALRSGATIPVSTAGVAMVLPFPVPPAVLLVPPGNVYRERLTSFGAIYSMAGFTAALGVEKLRVKKTGFPTYTASNTSGSVSYQTGGFKGGKSYEEFHKIKLIVSRFGGTLGNQLAADPNYRRNQVGLSVESTYRETTLAAFANRGVRFNQYGFGVTQDLGGGASLRSGVARRTGGGLPKLTMADAGLEFRF